MNKKYESPSISVETYDLEYTLAAGSVTPHLESGIITEEWEEQEIDLGNYNFNLK